MTPFLQSVNALVTRQLYEVNTLVGKMRPPMGPPGRPQCAVFLTIAEQFESAVRLSQAGLVTHAAVHVRSMTEALADLYLLGLDPQHVDRMRHKKLHGEKSFYEESLKSQHLSDDAKKMITARLAQCLQEHGPLHAVFKAKRKQADTFAAAGLEHLMVPYVLLCSYAHSDLAALAQRHQGEKGMTHRAEVDDGISYLILQLASATLMQATAPIKDIAKFPDGMFDKQFEAMHQIYTALVALRPGSDAKHQNEEGRP